MLIRKITCLNNPEAKKLNIFEGIIPESKKNEMLDSRRIPAILTRYET